MSTTEHKKKLTRGDYNRLVEKLEEANKKIEAMESADTNASIDTENKQEAPAPKLSKGAQEMISSLQGELQKEREGRAADKRKFIQYRRDQKIDAYVKQITAHVTDPERLTPYIRERIGYDVIEGKGSPYIKGDDGKRSPMTPEQWIEKWRGDDAMSHYVKGTKATGSRVAQTQIQTPTQSNDTIGDRMTAMHGRELRTPQQMATQRDHLQKKFGLTKVS